MIWTLTLLNDKDILLIKDDEYLVGTVGVPVVLTLKKSEAESVFKRAPIGNLRLVISEGFASVRSAVTLMRFLEKAPCNLERL